MQRAHMEPRMSTKHEFCRPVLMVTMFPTVCFSLSMLDDTKGYVNRLYYLELYGIVTRQFDFRFTFF